MPSCQLERNRKRCEKKTLTDRKSKHGGKNFEGRRKEVQREKRGRRRCESRGFGKNTLGKNSSLRKRAKSLKLTESPN